MIIRHWTSRPIAWSSATSQSSWKEEYDNYTRSVLVGSELKAWLTWDKVFVLAIMRNFWMAGMSSSGRRLMCGPRSYLTSFGAGGQFSKSSSS